MAKAAIHRKGGRRPLGKHTLGPLLSLRVADEMLKAIESLADGRMDRGE